MTRSAALPRTIGFALAIVVMFLPVPTAVDPAGRLGIVSTPARAHRIVPKAETTAALRKTSPTSIRHRLERSAHVTQRARPLPPGRLQRDRSSARALAVLEDAGTLVRGDRHEGADGIQHTRFLLSKQGLPVWNRPGILRERDGRLLGRAGWATLPPLALGLHEIERAQALALARAALPDGPERASPRVRKGFFVRDRRTQPAWRVTIPLSDPIATWQITLDARTGATLAAVDLVRTATGTGSVFDPNVALSPTPTDVPLERLDSSGQLQGDVVRVVDVRVPAAFRPGLDFLFPTSDPRFVQTSVYRAVTETGGFVEAHGFPAFTVPLAAYTNLPGTGAGGEFNNAFYDPFFQLLAFGNGDGAITSNLGTDLDVAAHETGHHVFEVLVQPEIVSSADPPFAMSEGVADTHAALVGGDPNVGESTIPGQPFLRTVDNAASFPDGRVDDPHITGLVYAGANWDLQQLLGGDAFATLLIEALMRLPSDALEADYRDAFLTANLETRAGAQQAAIQQIFLDRGFDAFEIPPDLQAFLDSLITLEDGIPDTRFLANGETDLFIFSTFPGTRGLTITTAGSGDVDLFAFPLVTADDPNIFVGSQGISTSDELVVVDDTTSPAIDADEFWFVQVTAFANSTYTVQLDAELPAPAVLLDGPAFESEITVGGGFEILTFATPTAGRVVRVEVSAIDGGLDPAVAIFDARSLELLASDDDSGPATDSLIQGASLPRADAYGLVVLSVTADVDPSVGAGRYAVAVSTCDNTAGPDSDGDGLRDACDDDDDGDGFGDALDSAPLDASLCFDLDVDGCDDCLLTGEPDPFDDGPDADLDGLCDGGDGDDDNDGCTDDIDAAPFLPSVDDDFDFVGADCDVCIDLPDPTQTDTDADGYGDRCDCDFDDDGFCNIDDFSLFLPDFIAGSETTEGTDMDDGGSVNIDDFSLFLPGFLRGSPGPSGLAP